MMQLKWYPNMHCHSDIKWEVLFLKLTAVTMQIKHNKKKKISVDKYGKLNTLKKS